MAPLTLQQFNNILFDTQLTKNCVDVSIENLNAVLDKKTTPTRVKTLIRSILTILPPHEHTTDNFLQCMVKKKANFRNVAELIPDATERAIFLAAANKIK